MLSPEERKERERAAKKRWRDANPDYRKDFYAEHREEAKKYSREWYVANREDALAVSAQWAAANVERANATKEKWAQANSEKVKAATTKYRRRDPARAQRWREANPEAVRVIRLRKYGMTPAEWDNMFAGQGFQCGACGGEDPLGANWATDHCHKTGKVRGILCSRCNLALGMAKDNPKTLRALAEYLEKQAGA